MLTSTWAKTVILSSYGRLQFGKQLRLRGWDNAFALGSILSVRGVFAHSRGVGLPSCEQWGVRDAVEGRDESGRVLLLSCVMG